MRPLLATSPPLPTRRTLPPEVSMPVASSAPVLLTSNCDSPVLPACSRICPPLARSVPLFSTAAAAPSTDWLAAATICMPIAPAASMVTLT
ncbi:hypothetical protein NB713_003336 [Xanthomonas sacchari]|nr:hypothetical protein [Xanthomonas sacchari]